MAKNIFLDPLTDRELMSSFGIQQENAPLTPEELAQMTTPVVEEAPIPTVTTPTTKPTVNNITSKQSTKAPIEDTQDDLSSEPPAPENPMSRSEALIAEYNRLMNEKEGDLAEARKSDRMLKVGGALGDALATYLNARSQMNVKAPGVQVQQGAGLGKVADMFATAPEITSDIAARREAMLKQYAELAKGERSQAQLDAQKELARDRAKLERQLLDRRLSAESKIAGMKIAEPTYEEKEDIKARKKEEIQINKENRAIKEKLDPAISNLDKQIKHVDKAIQLLTNPKTGKAKSNLTGPFDQYKASFTKEGQALEDALSNISLTEMTKAFAGMSKAIDSDAERAFFQAAQPSLKKYEDVNLEVLKEMKANLESLKEKSKSKLQEIEGSKESQAPYGEFAEMDGKQYKWNPSVNKYQLIQSK